MSLSVAQGSPFSVLGFTADQEDLYRLLLRSGERPRDRLEELSGMAGPELEEALTRLEAAGLVDVRSDSVHATAPDHALGRLLAEESRRVHHLTDQLQALRGLLPSLMADHLSARAPRGEPVTVEVVHGGDVVDLLRSLAVGSTGDLLWL